MVQKLIHIIMPAVVVENWNENKTQNTGLCNVMHFGNSLFPGTTLTLFSKYLGLANSPLSKDLVRREYNHIKRSLKSVLHQTIHQMLPHNHKNSQSPCKNGLQQQKCKCAPSTTSVCMCLSVIGLLGSRLSFLQ